MELITKINEAINGVVWGPAMIILIFGTGVYLSLRCGFPQLVHVRYIWRNTIGGVLKGKKSKSEKASGNVTAFQAVSTALASTIGVGNVAGVAGAIVIGGPGSIFWMWISSFFGMCTKYAEIVLAVRYRQVSPDGTYYGGPMYYIEKGLNCRWLAAAFSLFGGLACLGIGNATQAAEISVAVNNLTGSGYDSSFITAVVLAIIAGTVIIGGIKRIGAVTSYLVPAMALFYILGGLAGILINISAVPDALRLIFTEAFSFKSAGGGMLGYGIVAALRSGMSRGVFSNEAGLGSAPMAHAASNNRDPVKQGIWGIYEVFNTIIICTITGLVVVISGLWDGGLTGGALTAAAFTKLLGSEIGGDIVRISIILFALSSILGWSYYGDICWGYLTKNSRIAGLGYRVVFIIITFVGAYFTSSNSLEDTSGLSVIWGIADTLNGMMAIPNLIAMLALSGVVIKITRGFFSNKSNLRGGR